MDCGDAERILLSKHVAEDLEQLGHWKKHLHDLGEAEVKHGSRVSVVNLYTEELGNPEMPQKFLQARHKAAAAVPVTAEKPNKEVGVGWYCCIFAVIVFGAVAISGYLLCRAVPRQFAGDEWLPSQATPVARVLPVRVSCPQPKPSQEA